MTFPVAGSISVSLLLPLLLTHSVFRSYDGTTCCGTFPAR